MPTRNADDKSRPSPPSLKNYPAAVQDAFKLAFGETPNRYPNQNRILMEMLLQEQPDLWRQLSGAPPSPVAPPRLPQPPPDRPNLPPGMPRNGGMNGMPTPPGFNPFLLRR